MDLLIFEDEKDNAERLIYLLRQHTSAIRSIQQLESVAEGIQWFKNNGKADLIFMDIKLSDGDCFEIFEQVNCDIPIIFTTAYDSFALKAFKLHSVDYLLKPIDQGELQQALKKLEKYHGALQQQGMIARVVETYFSNREVRFIGKMNNQLVYVKGKDIAYISIDHGIVWATDKNNRTIPIDSTLEDAEALLDPQLFFRINRKVIMNIDAIDKITSYTNSRLVIKAKPDKGEELIVSRERVQQFKTWLGGV